MAKYVLQLDSHESNLCKMLCSLMETQSLVDLTVICKSYSVKVHKCLLAAKSEYFREKLRKDMSIDRVIINGVKPTVLKSLIIFMYCGETSIGEDDIHALISAANYFHVRGIRSILPEKLNCDAGKVRDLNLNMTPPLFFSNNIKVKYSNKVHKDNILNSIYHDRFKSFRGSNYNVGQTLSHETQVALAKEEAASHQALDELCKSMSNTSKLFIIDEGCTEATIETNLRAQFNNSDNVVQMEEYIIDNSAPLNLNKSSFSKEFSNDQSYNVEMNEPYNLHSDIPMLYKSNDGNFVKVNNEDLEQLTNEHTVSYQMIPQNNSMDYQEYICNNIDSFTVDMNSIQDTSSGVCYEIIEQEPSQKVELTFTQLVADTMNANYDAVDQYSTNANDYGASMFNNVCEEIVECNTIAVGNEETVQYSTVEDNYVLDYSIDIGNKENIPRKKRGRPLKKKMSESVNIDFSQFKPLKRMRNIDCTETNLSNKIIKFDQDQVCDLELNINAHSSSKLHPQRCTITEIVPENDQNDAEADSCDNGFSAVEILSFDKMSEMCSMPNQNRRQTRSSAKRSTF